MTVNSREVLRLLPGAKTGAEIGFRYVLDTPGVTCALSGMNTVEQVHENTKTAGRKVPFTLAQRKAFKKGIEKFKKLSESICTSCGYCMPCSAGVDIPANFMYLNRAKFLGLEETAIRELTARLKKWSRTDKTATVCVQCGKCLPKCPNKIPIIEQLQEVARLIKKHNK